MAAAARGHGGGDARAWRGGDARRRLSAVVLWWCEEEARGLRWCSAALL